MNSTLAEHPSLACDLQMQRARLDVERTQLLATLQSGMGINTDELRAELRAKQEDESVFLTPKGSPYSTNGTATYDIPVAFPEFTELDGHPPAPLHSSIPTSPYMTGSPEETYMNPYSSSPPYSPPYDSSPLSVNGVVCSDSCSSPGSFTGDMCSPTSIPCSTSANHQFAQFLPQPPMPSIPPTTSCNSLPFSTCCDQDLKNAPSISTLAYPQQQQQPQAWMPGMPDMMGYYNLNVPIVNVEPSSKLPVEASIVVHEQRHNQPQITFYPPSPQPESMPCIQYPQNGSIFEPYPPMSTCMPFPESAKVPTQEGRVRPPKKPKTVRPPVQVDDSDIKDIPSSAQLWEFTLRVLKKPKYNNMVCWENQKEGLFRFHDAQAFAALWGKHRNRPNMTYDKVARALRYYYKRNIFKQVGGRLTYRFSERLRKLYQNED